MLSKFSAIEEKVNEKVTFFSLNIEKSQDIYLDTEISVIIAPYWKAKS